jgi:hypothetical protein
MLVNGMQPLKLNKGLLYGRIDTITYIHRIIFSLANYFKR